MNGAHIFLVWFERSLHPVQVSGQNLMVRDAFNVSLTIKTDGVTSGEMDVDPCEWLRAVQG